jgi:hypothetical protein
MSEAFWKQIFGSGSALNSKGVISAGKNEDRSLVNHNKKFL